MSVELSDFDSIGDPLALADWALQTQVWNGRQVSWGEASEFCQEVEERILELLFQSLSDSAFEKLAAQFSWIGSIDANRALLAKDIQALDFSSQDRILQVGFGKSISKFWKKHKTEILIGAAAVAILTVVVVVAVSTAGAAAGGAAAVGGAALDRRNRKDPDRPPVADKPPNPPIASPAIAAEPKRIEPPPIRSFDPYPTNAKLLFGEKGMECNGRYSSYDEILQPPSPQHSWVANVLDTVGKSMIEPDLMNPDVSVPIREPSTRFSTIGPREPHLRIGGVNGINNSWDEANTNAQYLSSFVPNQSVDWVYNRSHGPVVDLAEVFTLNYPGHSPNIQQLLTENWTAFHEENKVNPQAKYLQFCHSQGTIHVRNALAHAPKEIRDRVVVVAIAPAAVVPDDTCYKSFNYACKNDIVPYGELVFAGALDPNECGMSKSLERVIAYREQLIFLEPDPGATEDVHSFQNPMYAEYIRKHIDNYIKQNGERQ